MGTTQESQPTGLSQRLTSLPSEMFLKVLMDILPDMRERWMNRKRPLSAELAWAAERYSAVQAVDGSTLDALIRKMGLLQDLPENPLATGRHYGAAELVQPSARADLVRTGPPSP